MGFVDKAKVGVGIEEVLRDRTIRASVDLALEVRHVGLSVARLRVSLRIAGYLDVKPVAVLSADEGDQVAGIAEVAGRSHARWQVAAQRDHAAATHGAIAMQQISDIGTRTAHAGQMRCRIQAMSLAQLPHGLWGVAEGRTASTKGYRHILGLQALERGRCGLQLLALLVGLGREELEGKAHGHVFVQRGIRAQVNRSEYGDIKARKVRRLYLFVRMKRYMPEVHEAITADPFRIGADRFRIRAVLMLPGLPMSPSVALRPSPPLPEFDAWRARLDELTPETLWWLSGYAAALAQARSAEPSVPAKLGPQAVARATVIYGSQTGNARRAAEALLARLEAEGLSARLLRADAYPQRELATERLVYFVLSTQGEGEPSEDAQALVEWLEGRRAPRLEGLHFGVLGLGDSSYAKFCEVGKRVEARLLALGAQPILARADADLEIETVAQPWREQALLQARGLLRSSVPSASVTPLRPQHPASGTREHPALLELFTNQRLTARDSDKDVRHIELDLSGSGLRYLPGDALGVFAPSPPQLVDAVLQMTGLSGDALIEHGGESLPLSIWLSERRELTRLARPTLTALAARFHDPALSKLLGADQNAELAALLERWQLIDALRRWPTAWTGDALVAALRPLTPRLYSIASSQTAVADEVHLTVDVVGFGDSEALRLGTASHYLASAAEGDRLRCYVESNERFRLPTDTARDVIMIGPGTGVAPFRAFVQERQASEARGRNWLFFGARRSRSDFLYQTEWQSALKSGALTRLDLAFSRDGEQKVHVQQRLLEHGRELVEWIENGAHLYVCGAQAMGRDVHAALQAVFASRLGSRDLAEQRLKALQQEGRYARDVY